MNVVLPAPLWPTSARLWPCGMNRLMSRERPRAPGPGIAEADVLEADAVLAPSSGAPGAAGLLAGRRAVLTANGEELEQVRHVEVVLVHAADGREDDWNACWPWRKATT